MGETKDFLLEIGTEEMPSAPLLKAVAQYKKLIVSGLDEAGLAHGEARIISTPRRLSAYVKDVALATEEINEVMRGPKCEIAFDAEGNPTKAALGFAKPVWTPQSLPVALMMTAMSTSLHSVSFPAFLPSRFYPSSLSVSFPQSIGLAVKGGAPRMSALSVQSAGSVLFSALKSYR